METKKIQSIKAGFEIDRDSISPMAFEFQKDIVQWAVRKGKAAILTGCGTGKSLMSLEWSKAVVNKTNGNVLILAPLCVVDQTIREAQKFKIGSVNKCRTQADVEPGINITNYEMMEHFDMSAFTGVVLDESSIMKSFTSHTTQYLTDACRNIPYRLMCTATISPNSYVEIGTSCEFLGIMSRSEMLATYFVHDGGKTSEWRLKKSGAKKFWEFFATWAIYFNSPSDLGYDIKGYDLPELKIHKIITESEVRDGELFAIAAETLEERRIARKESIESRVATAKELINSRPDEQWLCWVDYNDESLVLHKAIQGSVEVKGSDDPEFKAKASIDFANGDINYLVSKASIFGFGSNFQSCHNMIFCGLSDSYERLYQAIRRCWRFGQKEPVDVYIIISQREINILENIQRKEKLMEEMQRNMTELMKEVTLSEIHQTTRITTDYTPDKEMRLPKWA